MRGGGPQQAGTHTSLGFFLYAPNLFVWLKEAPDFVFTHNTIFHIVSHLSDHLDQASHLQFVEFVPPLSHVALLKFNPKPNKICFPAYLTTQIIQKRS